jgi:hypothetical protein
MIGVALRSADESEFYKYAPHFVRSVDQWGGRSARAMTKNNPQHYQHHPDKVATELLIFVRGARQTIEREDWRDVGVKIVRLSRALFGLGPSYASKYARFLFPEDLAVLDAVLFNHVFGKPLVGSSLYPEFYGLLISDLQSISTTIRIADAEAALFAAIRHKLQLKPTSESATDLSWASELLADAPDIPDPQTGLEWLASFAPVFEEPTFAFATISHHGRSGDRIIVPTITYSEDAHRFLSEASAIGWVLPHFDWSLWAQSREAQALIGDPAALQVATARQLAKLTTLCIRQEHYMEAALLRAFETGLLGRIAMRASTIVHSGLRPAPE